MSRRMANEIQGCITTKPHVKPAHLMFGLIGNSFSYMLYVINNVPGKQ
jgi:hypothetical protein